MTMNDLAKMIRDHGEQHITTSVGDDGVARFDEDGDVEIAWSNGMTTGADHCINELSLA